MHSECEGHYTAAEFKALCEEYGNMGLRCGDKDASLTPDEVVLLSLCRRCNSPKTSEQSTIVVAGFRLDKLV
jgi:hypothetical protein